MGFPFHRAYVHIDTREKIVEVIRGWPVPSESYASTEVPRLLYLGTAGLVRTIIELFPGERSVIASYFRDVAKAVEDGSW